MEHMEKRIELEKRGRPAEEVCCDGFIPIVLKFILTIQLGIFHDRFYRHVFIKVALYKSFSVALVIHLTKYVEQCKKPYYEHPHV